MGNDLYIYVDESGNSGLVLDPKQPKFWLCALVCKEDLDSVALPELAIIRRKLKYALRRDPHAELHGNRLKYEGIKRIVPELIKISARSVERFAVIHIDKGFLARLKIADIVLSPDWNPAITKWTHETPLLRQWLVHTLVECMEGDVADVWPSILHSDKEAVLHILKQTHIRLLASVASDRIKNLLGDAIGCALSLHERWQVTISLKDAPKQ
jgi:hypothetical protein